MRLLFLDSIEKETYGGMEEWIRMVADGLSNRGHKVTVAGRAESEFLNRIKNCNDKVEILALNISGDFNPFTIRKIKSYISKNSINKVIVNFTKDIRLGGIASRWDGTPNVIWSVGLNITKSSLSHRFLTPRLIDGVITPSQALKNQITKTGYIETESVKVIPIGIPDNNFVLTKNDARIEINKKYNLKNDHIIAVTSGRFIHQKGHIYLIDAARKISERFPNIRFLWLGDGPLKDILLKKINEYGMTTKFIFTGMLNNTELELTGADLMIHPSIDEPFGIVLAEAMRSRLPIVASEVGGIPEVVEKNQTAKLVMVKDAAALAEAVIDLLSYPDEMNRLGNNGYTKWSNDFRIDKMINSVEDYLNSFEFVDKNHE